MQLLSAPFSSETSVKISPLNSPPLIETSSRLCLTTVYLPAFTSRSAASRPVR